MKLVAGLDYLYGKAEADGDTFDYAVDLAGTNPPASIPPGEERRIEDKRNFAGLYGNLEWNPARALRLEAGLRLNRTEEERGEGEEGAAEAGGDEDKREELRPSGGVGVTWTAWQRERDLLRVFGSWKNTFKPAAIDFNLAEDPAAEGESGILKPETSNSFEAGLKAELLDRALRLELLGFLMDLENLVVSQAVGGLAGARQRGEQPAQGRRGLGGVSGRGTPGHAGLVQLPRRALPRLPDRVRRRADPARGQAHRDVPAPPGGPGRFVGAAPGRLRLGRARATWAAATSTSATRRSPTPTPRSPRSPATGTDASS